MKLFFRAIVVRGGREKRSWLTININLSQTFRFHLEPSFFFFLCLIEASTYDFCFHPLPNRPAVMNTKIIIVDYVKATSAELRNFFVSNILFV